MISALNIRYKHNNALIDTCAGEDYPNPLENSSIIELGVMTEYEREHMPSPLHRQHHPLLK